MKFSSFINFEFNLFIKTLFTKIFPNSTGVSSNQNHRIKLLMNSFTPERIEIDNFHKTIKIVLKIINNVEWRKI